MRTLIMKRFVDVFIAPIAMIDGVRDTPHFWAPIISMLFLHIVVGALHLALVDHGYPLPIL